MATTFEEKQLAQARPTGTSAETGLSASGSRFIVRQIWIMNTSGGAASYDLYHDDDGTTYGNATRIAGRKSIATSDYVILNTYIPVADGGAIGVQSTVGSALVFTFYGAEVT